MNYHKLEEIVDVNNQISGTQDEKYPNRWQEIVNTMKIDQTSTTLLTSHGKETNLLFFSN